MTRTAGSLPTSIQAWRSITAQAAKLASERARQYMLRQRLGALSGVVPALYLCWLLHAEVPWQQLAGWVTLLFAVDATTVWHTTRYLSRARDGERRRGWVIRQSALQTCAGVVWSFASLWMQISTDTLAAVAIVLVAVFSIGVMGMLHYRFAFISFTVGMWTLPALVLLTSERPEHLRYGIGVLVVALAVNFFVWEASQQLVNGLEERFRADALAAALHHAAERNHSLATRDELTGILNRREGMRRLGECAAGLASLGHHALLLVDVDNFKRVNDVYGHPAGDVVLRRVAERLTAAVREGDQVFRVGGEEFMIVLVGCEERDEVADRIRLTVADTPIVLPEGVELVVTVSAGLTAIIPGESPDAAYARADQALYRAKAAGRNLVVAA